MDKVKDKRSLVAAACVSAALLISAILLTVNLSPSVNAVFSSGSADLARLTVNVVEGYSEAPIAGAKVVIVETGKAYETNENGMTGIIEVPFVRDTRYDRILQKPWGEVSLIIYKDGFVPYALFYLQLLKGQTREGVKILLFEHDEGEINAPFSIIEGPSRVWVNKLVEMYQPKIP